MNLMTGLLFAVAVSLDGLGAGIAYGLKNIRMPFSSMAVIGTATVAMMWLAVAAAGWFSRFIGTGTAYGVGALLLIALGLWSMLQEWLKQYLPDEQASHTGAQIKLNLGFLRLVIQVFKRPTEADVDNSGELNCVEACVLGVALAVDALVAGFGAALAGGVSLWVMAAVGLVQMLFIYAGTRIMPFVNANDLQKKFPYVPGSILILIGLLRFW